MEENIKLGKEITSQKDDNVKLKKILNHIKKI